MSGQPFRATRAVINTQALQHNVQRVREYAPQSQVMAVIKANAYGHGLLQVARSLEAVDAFAIACVDEALQLRLGGITKPLLVLGGFNHTAELSAAYDYELITVINNNNQLQVLLDFIAQKGQNLTKQIQVWLKLDTGMHRLGFLANELEVAYDKITSLSQINSNIGIMSHFACADEKGNPYNQQQFQSYQQVLEKLTPALTSMANSAAIISLPESHFKWVRAGIMVYGINPFPEHTGSELGLNPVMTLKAKIIAIKKLLKGEKIGYGSSWECPENMDVAVVAIGYGDGYPRHARSGTPVKLKGIETQLLGRVSMDMISIDLRPLKRKNKTVKIGDEVTLWGDGLAIERIAHYADTIAYELLCSVTTRVKLEYI